jgi:CopG family transcriptional regulator, nickel-responsive regulator
MQRITITIEDELLAEIDAAAEARGYQSRSEIIRDLARAGLQQSTENADASGQCVAALVYVYDHASRDLSKRLVQNFHGHHDLSLATLHVHLDDDSCMEVTALKGSSSEVKHLAEHVIAERGVRYGRVVMIPVSSRKSVRKASGHRHK